MLSVPRINAPASATGRLHDKNAAVKRSKRKHDAHKRAIRDKARANPSPTS